MTYFWGIVDSRTSSLHLHPGRDRRLDKPVMIMASTIILVGESLHSIVVTRSVVATKEDRSMGVNIGPGDMSSPTLLKVVDIVSLLPTYSQNPNENTRKYMFDSIACNIADSIKSK